MQSFAKEIDQKALPEELGKAFFPAIEKVLNGDVFQSGEFTAGLDGENFHCAFIFCHPKLKDAFKEFIRNGGLNGGSPERS